MAPYSVPSLASMGLFEFRFFLSLPLRMFRTLPPPSRVLQAQRFAFPDFSLLTLFSSLAAFASF